MLTTSILGPILTEHFAVRLVGKVAAPERATRAA
jgi:hypothetical protein